jgi:hypothetical protein
MRATIRKTMKRFGTTRIFLSACGLVVTSMVIAACADLTGPKSPETPINVTATLSSATSVSVSWSPSPQSDGVVSYNILRNGTKVGESTTTSYTDTGLAEKTTYKYTVSANCRSGLLSEASVETVEATVTTADVTPPVITFHQPPSGFVGVSTAANAVVTFNEAMDPTTINPTTFTLKVGTTPIAGTVAYNAPTHTATFTPTPSLPSSAIVTATITTGVKDVAGNRLAADFVWTFTIRDEVAPTVIANFPANGASGVPVSAVVTVTFSEAMDATTITAAGTFTLKLTSAPGTAVTGTVDYNAATRVATFTPSSPLSAPVNYTATVLGTVKDAAGNSMGTPFQFAFSTGDTTPPTVVSTLPANLATNVPTNQVVSATFSEAMDATTINGTTFTLRVTATSVAVAGTAAYNAATHTATFTPSAALASGTTYTATVTTGAKDIAGNAMASNFPWTFITVDNVPPTVIAVSPVNAATGVATSTVVNVTFSEAMEQSTINATNIKLSVTAGGAAVAGSVAYNAATNTATFTPTAALVTGTGYTVTVTTGVKDAAGNSMTVPFTSAFTTFVPDTTPPTVTSVLPANSATNVAVNTAVNITFSEAMDATTITTTTIKLNNTNTSAAIAGAVSYNAATHVATFTPTVALANGTGYTVTATTGVKDVSGNALASPFTSTFTTVPAPDTTAPTVTATLPADGSTNVAINTTVTATFSEAMDPTTITAAGTFTLKLTLAPGTAVAGTVTYDAATHVATFTPTSPLANSTGYTATITTAAKDAAGNALAANKVFAFTTIADTTPPTVLSTSPANGATAVPITTTVKVTFSEAMDASTVTAAGTFTLKATGPPSVDVAGTVTYDAATHVATFTPTLSLAPSTNYTATVTTTAKDAAGNPLSPGTLTITFTTAP